MPDSPDSAIQTNQPPLLRDGSFWSMTSTQFLGAFNDNLFKQLVLLTCIDVTLAGGKDYQSIAMAVFAIPFVMFSGYGGYLSDRTSKRRIIVLAKVAEIVVMLLGLLAFLSGELPALMAVLFCMSTQSAFFGPSKYGILPEMLRDSDLPQANGIIQMTTFVAIIFGMALAGYSKDWFGDRLWIVSGVCVGIAIVGTITSLAIRRTPVARPGLPFRLSALGINRDTWLLLRANRRLFGVLMISSLFWFLGGVVQLSVNAFGKIQMDFGNTRTSILAACMGIGIALGCVLAGKMSHEQVNFRLVRIGAWGLVVSLAGMAWLGVSNMQPLDLEWMARITLTLLGVFAGLFVVPLQVYLQASPPEQLKGRMIGTMNLINWIGIVISAGFYQVSVSLLASYDLPMSWTFLSLALLVLPVALLYRPPDTKLDVV